MLQYFGDPEDAGYPLTSEQVCQKFRVSQQYLNWLVETRQLPCQIIGVSQVRFRLDVVEDFFLRNFKQIMDQRRAEREATEHG